METLLVSLMDEFAIVIEFNLNFVYFYIVIGYWNLLCWIELSIIRN